MKKKILIVDKVHTYLLTALKDMGFHPYYLPNISRQELCNELENTTGLIIRRKTTVDSHLLKKAHHLKFVARAGSGMDTIDESYLKNKGIIAFNTPESSKDALAEHTLGLLLNLLHNIHISFEQIKKGIWERESNRGIELNNKTVGIYGVGNMGMAFASKLASLNCHVIGYDKYRKNYSNDFIEEYDLNEFMKHTEILSIHIPLTDETNSLFVKTYLTQFLKLKILINTARGKIINIEDILDLLENEKLYGIALDVLENECFDTFTKKESEIMYRLTSHPRIVITPHIGSWTKEEFKKTSMLLVEKIRKLNLNTIYSED